jgi:hypothetical protein
MRIKAIAVTTTSPARIPRAGVNQVVERVVASSETGVVVGLPTVLAPDWAWATGEGYAERPEGTLEVVPAAGAGYSALDGAVLPTVAGAGYGVPITPTGAFPGGG